MTPELPRVSVIFPTFNRCEVVRRTIESLLGTDYPPDRLQIIVADNSTDGTPDMVRELARDTGRDVVLLASTQRLPAVKRNEAVLREALAGRAVHPDAPDALHPVVSTLRL